MNLKKVLLFVGLASALIGSVSTAKEDSSTFSGVETQKRIYITLSVIDFESNNESGIPYKVLSNTDASPESIVNTLSQNGKVKVIRSALSSFLYENTAGGFSATQETPYTKSCKKEPQKEPHCETAFVEDGYRITLVPSIQNDTIARIGIDLEYNELQSIEEVNEIFVPGTKIQLPHVKSERQYQTVVLYSGQTVAIEAFKNGNHYKIAMLRLDKIQ